MIFCSLASFRHIVWLWRWPMNCHDGNCWIYPLDLLLYLVAQYTYMIHRQSHSRAADQFLIINILKWTLSTSYIVNPSLIFSTTWFPSIAKWTLKLRQTFWRRMFRKYDLRISQYSLLRVRDVSQMLLMRFRALPATFSQLGHIFSDWGCGPAWTAWC